MGSNEALIVYFFFFCSCSIEPNDNAELEYCYPEVEPKFDLEQLATMFGKPQPQPALEPMYCPPPEMGSPQVQRKPLPPQRPAFPSPKPLRGGFSYTGIPTPVPGQGGASLGVVRQSPGRTSPDFPRKLSDPPALPARKGKALAPPKPLPRPPPLTRHTTEPIMRYPSLPCRGTVHCLNLCIVMHYVSFIVSIHSIFSVSCNHPNHIFFLREGMNRAVNARVVVHLEWL